MKRALVTGAGGFIGSHLVETLLAEEWEVRAFLRYNSRSSIGNLELLDEASRKAIEVRWGDLRDGETVRQAVEGCSHVFHLAALISIPYSYASPSEFVQVNALGTTHVLNACRQSDALDRVVVTSTSEVYGSAQYAPIDEKHPLQGQSPYSASKIAADHMAESYHRAFDLPVGILRPFNTYGPRQSMRAVIPTIVSQLLSQQTVRIGSLSPRRDLTFVKDTARGFVLMATVPDAPLGQPVNLGHGEDISVGELFELLRELTGSSANVETDAARVRPAKSEVERLCASAERARSVLGWKPQVKLREGLRVTIEWVRQNLGSVRSVDYHI